MLSFMLNLKVKEDFVDKAVESLSAIDRAAQGHEGRISFRWFQHLEEPVRFTLVEQWESQEALDQHIPRIIDIWNAFTPCLDGEPVSTRLDQLVK